MPQFQKIEGSNLADYIMELDGKGLTVREMSQRIKEDKNISIHFTNIAAWLKKVRLIRAEKTKALVQDSISKSIPRDIAILDEQIMQMDAWRKNEKLKITDRLGVIREQRATIAEKLKHCGVEENIENNIIKVSITDD